MNKGFEIEGRIIKIFGCCFDIMCCDVSIKIETLEQDVKSSCDELSIREWRRLKTCKKDKEIDISRIRVSSKDIEKQLIEKFFVIRMKSNSIVLNIYKNDHYVTYRYEIKNGKTYLWYYNIDEEMYYLICDKFSHIGISL